MLLEWLSNEQQKTSMSCISIICPCFNEESSLMTFYTAVQTELNKTGYDYELLFIDDGSTDNTPKILSDIAQKDGRVQVITLSRNFGKESALTAGLDNAGGDAAIPMDADMQDPPEVIHQLIRGWEEGFDVVLAKRVKRDTDSFLKRFSAKLYYKTHNLVSEVPIPENVGDFRLISRQVIDVLKLLPENQRFMKGIFAWVGFNTKTIEYERTHRVNGETSFNTLKLWKLALDGITSFSTLPIRVWLYIGSTISLFAFIYGLVTIIKILIFGVETPGYASLIVAVLFLGGVQLIGIGLLGEYIGRIYLESKKRPSYIIAKKSKE